MATLYPPQYNQTGSIGATQVQLTADSIVPKFGIQIKALAANGSNYVYVGLTGVTTSTGYQLAAGVEMFLSLAEVQDANLIYMIGSTSGLAVCWRVV